MRITIVTPTLNQAEFLPETLASVRRAAANAPALEVEHIVRDGGSDDGTLEILAAQEFASWVSEPDGGQSVAINKGLAAASGEILAYLCSDDLLEPDALALVHQRFRERPEAEFVYGDYFFLESDSGWKRAKQAGEFSLARLHRHNFLSQPATYWRASVVARHGLLDESLKFCMDHEFWLRASADTRWSYLREPLATMRLHADAKTSAAISAMWWESARMQRRYGHGWRPYFEALRMALYGQHYYRLKRRYFRWLGRRRADRGAHS